MSKRRQKCSYIGCSRTKARFPLLHFFQFPVKRASICDQWITNCCNENLLTISKKNLSSRVVCEKHFTDDGFKNSLRNLLTHTAVPTLLSIDADEPYENNSQTPNPLNDSFSITSQPTSSVHTKFSRRTLFTTSTPIVSDNLHNNILSPHTPSQKLNSTHHETKTPQYKKLKSVHGRKPTPRKEISRGKKCLLAKMKRYRREKKRYQQTVRRSIEKPISITKELLIEGMKSFLPSSVCTFFSMQLNHVGAKRTWSDDEKRQALSMHYKSPSLFKQMKKDGFALPNRRTMARWLEVVNLGPGLCPDLSNLIKTKVSCMTTMEKKCIILLDEMAIKKNLEYDSKRDVVEGKCIIQM